jgi:hypothetical protein
MKRIAAVGFGLLLVLQMAGQGSYADAYWWPKQKAPAAFMRLKGTNLAERNLIQSVSGLAARAVNNGTNDKMIWTVVTAASYNAWIDSLKNRLSLQDLGDTDIWSAVGLFRDMGLIKGYVLYRQASDDYSVNAATLYAGLYDGILVDESLEATAKAKGLSLLYDARSMSSLSSYTTAWFDGIKSSVNRNMIVTCAPDDYRNREVAVAHKCMVFWGVNSFYNYVLSWLNPVSPVIGWNDGDESTHVKAASQYGHFTTGASVCNLLLLSAGSADMQMRRAKPVDPASLDWSDARPYHAFVMSDGDNMTIQVAGMPLLDEYWSNRYCTQIPMSWTNCPVNLSMMVPDAWSYFVSNTNATPGALIEFGGGYQYPDYFASLRGNDTETILRTFAGKVGKHMQRTGVRVLGFITRDATGSSAAMKAYRAFVDSVPDLTGIVVVQYVPYNGGGGNIYWITNRDGVAIPVVTAKYQQWANLSGYTGSGNPQQLGSWLNSITQNGECSGAADKDMNWTIVHAWSYFKKNADGTIADATDSDATALRGVTPVKWTKDRINGRMKIVTIEELLWRIRMKYHPAQTKSIIAASH